MFIFSPNLVSVDNCILSYFYSVLYYNSVIWLTPEINAQMKQYLLSVSANALKGCNMYNYSEISFLRIHGICKKCTPSQIMSYQNALWLHTFFNGMHENCSPEHVRVIMNVVCTSRQFNFEIIRNNNLKIGMNIV